MKLLEILNGTQITTIVVTAVVVIGIVTVAFLIRSYHMEETQKYLDAGCEQVLLPGRIEEIWSNCKKSLENTP